MKPELDDALCRDFPKIFAHRHGDMRSTCMCWGFECHDGWEPLIRRLCEQLQKVSDESGVQAVATQVKEKFGSLHFYLMGATDAHFDLIRAAEEESARTCEICGAPGNIGDEAWLQCRCDKCRDGNS